jgi:CRP-like cAMP-binding protein
MDQQKRRRSYAGSPTARSSTLVRAAAKAPIFAPTTLPQRSDLVPRDNGLRARTRGVRSVKFPKARDVVVSGVHNDCIYFNHDGWLARYKILRKGSRQIMDFILPGQVFGLPACVFQIAPYSVLTITAATVSAIPFDAVDNVFERDPALAKTLLWSAVQDAAILGEHLVDTGRRSAYERVSHLLLELFVRVNRTQMAGEMTLSIPLTQELIADALGLTAVHVNRTLRALRADRLIAVNGRAITIVNFEALALLSDFEKSYLGQISRSLQGLPA